MDKQKNLKDKVKIAVVGKYVELPDAYLSVSEALAHGGLDNNCKVKIEWVNSEFLTKENIEEKLAGVNGILVPGGFGERGVEGKVLAAQYAREKYPLFRYLLRHADGGSGICSKRFEF